jgi:23S rRNA pseudouridine1911/1915/1917 synthase
MKNHKVRVSEASAGLRLDVFLHQALPHISRAQAKKLLDSGHVAGPATKPSDKVQAGWNFTVLEAPPKHDLLPEAMEFEIVFEDEHLAVVNKPAGLVVHPGAGHATGTLVHGLLDRLGSLAALGSPHRPGIVHRLDKDTSGLLVVARTDHSYQSLCEQIALRSAGREYLALVCGHMVEPRGRIEASIGRSRRDRTMMTVDRRGQVALTKYSVERVAGPCDFVRLTLASGRTHQIRVHLRHVGKPVFGDPTYGGRSRWALSLPPQDRLKVKRALQNIPRQALHASRLSFDHPVTGQPLVFESPLPDDFATAMEILSS